ARRSARNIAPQARRPVTDEHVGDVGVLRAEIGNCQAFSGGEARGQRVAVRVAQAGGRTGGLADRDAGALVVRDVDDGAVVEGVAVDLVHAARLGEADAAIVDTV